MTGATSGIGQAAAIELARRGAELVLVARDAGRAEATVAAIRSAAPAASVEVMLADLSSQSEVRALAEAVRRKHARLDVLVNNAGAVFQKRQLTVDGIERTLALNHLSYFLLTNLLLDLLRASGAARIVSTASGAHFWGRIAFDDLQHERGYEGLAVYSASKLANVLFTRELARRLAGSSVTANCFHPGTVRSGFAQNERSWIGIGMRVIAPLLRTPEKGAATLVYLASSPEVAGVSGEYFKDCRVARSSRAARDEAAARRLWEVSAQMTGL
jgi:NAD(P)-dependent dehydrogenase (short-subunit alcohol dehydrogenase family)